MAETARAPIYGPVGSSGPAEYLDLIVYLCFPHIIGFRGRGDVVLLPVEASSYSDLEVWNQRGKDHDVAFESSYGFEFLCLSPEYLLSATPLNQLAFSG